jgi:hypothetical protein
MAEHLEVETEKDRIKQRVWDKLVPPVSREQVRVL